jgi:MFS transporter, DHA1 family, tetracycline resistance protein
MNKRLLAIALLTLVNVLGFAVFIPVFPFVVEQYGGSAITYGFLLSTYSIFQFVGAPILGSLSDRYGRRPLLLISHIGTIAAWTLFGLAYFVSPTIKIGILALPLVMITLARIVDGLTGGDTSILNAYISDVIPAHEKTKVFGMVGAIYGVGIIVGPLIGGFTSSYGIGFLGTVIFSLTVSVITLFSMYFYLPESLPKKFRVKELRLNILKEINVVEKIAQYHGNRLIKQLFFIRAFFTIVFSGYTTAVVLLVKDAFVLSSRDLGILFLGAGLFLIINQMFVTRYVAGKLGDLTTFYIGQILLVISLVLLMFLDSIPTFLFNTFIATMGFAFSMITFKSLISNHVDGSKQGEINGIDESIVAAGSAIAPIIAGFLYDEIGQYAFVFFAISLLFPYGVIWFRTGSPVAKLPVK